MLNWCERLLALGSNRWKFESKVTHWFDVWSYTEGIISIIVNNQCEKEEMILYS